MSRAGAAVRLTRMCFEHTKCGVSIPELQQLDAMMHTCKPTPWETEVAVRSSRSLSAVAELVQGQSGLDGNQGAATCHVLLQGFLVEAVWVERFGNGTSKNVQTEHRRSLLGTVPTERGTSPFTATRGKLMLWICVVAFLFLPFLVLE